MNIEIIGTGKMAGPCTRCRRATMRAGAPLRNLRWRGLHPAGGPYNDLRLHPIDAEKAH